LDRPQANLLNNPQANLTTALLGCCHQGEAYFPGRFITGL
ncbi:hypothetical protein scyTo_0009751, partial [Scyliorhinus torazame]|nr:hypothetical protein [Scyliorhinus torazame]